MKITLGMKVRDKITGYTGVVVGITKWLHGCERCVVQSQEMDAGKPVDPQTFDLPQLEAIERIAPEPTRSPGGNRDDNPAQVRR